MSEAKAFAAGYAAAIKVLQLVKAREEGWSGCGNGRIAAEGAAFAIGELERSLEEVGSWFESWQLGQDPDFRESLAQMQRGEGRTIVPDELDAKIKELDPMYVANVDNPNHWSNWNQR